KTKTILVELRPNERPLARAVMRMLRELSGWEAILLRTTPLVGRPAIPRDLAKRVHVRTARDGASRSELLAGTAIFVPGLAGLPRVLLEAKAAGCAVVRPPGVAEQPELAAAATARLTENDERREREQERARADAQGQTFDDVADQLDAIYRGITHRRRAKRSPADPLADRPWIVADLHLHTSWSFDCTVDPSELVTMPSSKG